MKKQLILNQLDTKIKKINALSVNDIPSTGWIKAIRLALGMSQEQLGKKLKITRQSVQELELREKDGTISLKTLKEVARAMDIQLVYGLIPNEGSLEALIEKKATELATRIVMRTSHSMKLEDQQNTGKRLQKAIKERAQTIKNEMPKILWD
ncbi:MAG: mobile mystery protein A [Chitinophagaceae bacterium]|nr:mobile mystery protein A [Chitinophagaceae bacterium]